MKPSPSASPFGSIVSGSATTETDARTSLVADAVDLRRAEGMLVLGDSVAVRDVGDAKSPPHISGSGAASTAHSSPRVAAQQQKLARCPTARALASAPFGLPLLSTSRPITTDGPTAHRLLVARAELSTMTTADQSMDVKPSSDMAEAQPVRCAAARGRDTSAHRS
jgi:hypothetical protein